MVRARWVVSSVWTSGRSVAASAIAPVPNTMQRPASTWRQTASPGAVTSVTLPRPGRTGAGERRIQPADRQAQMAGIDVVTGV